MNISALQSWKWQLIGMIEVVVPRRNMQPSIARDSGQLDPRRSTTSPQSAATSPLVACATASTVQDHCPGLPTSV